MGKESNKEKHLKTIMSFTKSMHLSGPKISFQETEKLEITRTFSSIKFWSKIVFISCHWFHHLLFPPFKSNIFIWAFAE